MADDLGDDWWVADNKESVSELDESIQKGEIKTVKKKKAQKKKLAVDDKENGDAKPEKKKKVSKRKLMTEDILPKTKKKKKMKKQTVNEDTPALNVNSLWSYFEKELEKSLSRIELEDIKPNHDSWFIAKDTLLKSENNLQLSSYLKAVIPNWEEKCIKVKDKPGSPVMLIVTSGGQRAADLLRDTSDFRGKNCKTVKLFAKHLKIKDQVEFLNKNVIHLGVGTPNRIAKLFELGNLSIKNLKYVIVDWSWKDEKTRSLWNMHGVKDDFIELFQKYILPRCKRRKLSVGLF